VKRKRLTPQEKKLLSYTKDTRNTYAESHSRSRFSIARNKAYGHQALRHSQKLALKTLTKVTNEEIDIVEAKMKSVEPKRWRKFADSLLGEFVSILLKVREERGINEELKTSQILEKARRKARLKWRSNRW
jgi:hypothetical protein